MDRMPGPIDQSPHIISGVNKGTLWENTCAVGPTTLVDRSNPFFFPKHAPVGEFDVMTVRYEQSVIRLSFTEQVICV